MSEKPRGASLQAIAVGLLILAIFFGWLSYTPGNFLDNFASNLSTMLVGVVLTVLILDSRKANASSKKKNSSSANTRYSRLS